MKTYLFSYFSEKNMFRGSIAVQAGNLVGAQDQFLSWLREQPDYKHLWQLSFQAEEIQSLI